MSVSVQTRSLLGHCTAVLFMLLLNTLLVEAHTIQLPRATARSKGRERISLNEGWKFSRFTFNPDSLSYSTLKPWILPSANDFIKGPEHQPPSGTPPGRNVTYVQASFDDSSWEGLNLPHDWAIKGPFNAPGISGGMGRLPTNGVGWYRRKVTVAPEDKGKSIFLDIDGAMSYSAVWVNGRLVGGWPYGYASFRLDLTQHLKVGGDNMLAIRLDNAADNSRWYPGAGIYRNVWLIKTSPAHVTQYGTFITTPDVSDGSATVNLAVEVQNDASSDQAVKVETEIRVLDGATGQPGTDVVAKFSPATIRVPAGQKKSVSSSTRVKNPRLWGPAPAQTPNMYVAMTTLSAKGTILDTYETPFGIRSVSYDGNKGVSINGKPVRIWGTCNHGDHGALGVAFNTRAAERQLSMLQEMGSNSFRTSHNPPTPELLDLADRMGFMVVDEIFDAWNVAKTSHDFSSLFPDWHEPDLRAFIRRDRNHPSIIAWSFGNELGEQSAAAGGATAQSLRVILLSEDPTRPTTAAMNVAGPGTALASALDIISLNYQGEGHGTSTNGSFAAFHAAYPDKVIWSSESASTVSTRGTYVFPVTSANSAIVGPGSGLNESALQVSAYELYHPSWASSPDKVFAAHDRNPYVAGEFVWTGWDYLGEPTPYDSPAGVSGGARSSYFGIIDLAGFRKDRFYLYQARWRPELPVAHILPHWTWPERVGLETPVHVFSSGDEAELFVNGNSAGRVKRGQYEYRFRWNKVVYQPGEVKVVAYKGGKEWAVDVKRTVGEAKGLNMTADRTTIRGDGDDLSFVTVAVVDENGDTVPRASNAITFSVSGPGQIVATDNGDPADMTAFPSLTRKAFSGLSLAVVRADKGASGDITVSASASGLKGARVTLKAR
ncbi:glycoside hydrolase family 2 protein [Parathielavia appendiculata]|uniref:Glycoside hydrolase family 2 protein n=1 Tax=Parathielavia appendiculata TaxID=2587402 RepID=A0AAN6TRC5_9PEZI|nr:glycoside hydrolase family 2 protein [Parathielavia appendiculata]